MKKETAHQRRMHRRAKHAAPATLSLTSLMDIFTILLFFLLVSVSTSQKMPDERYILLPKSTAEELPKESLTVEVSSGTIIVQGQLIAETSAVELQDSPLIIDLKKELDYQAGKSNAPLNEQGIPEREITILMDSKIPYTVLDKIMKTCMLTEYSKISFAVMQDKKKEPGKETSS
jgi:biopolymer transport protein TolR